MHKAAKARAVRHDEAGFSLIELIIAMTVTLIVSGAIYGLLAGGQNAFRREPELADRQQNARIAMDLIRRDVLDAGSGMVPFVQAFTPGLDGTGVAPAVGQAVGASGSATDVLEMLTTDGNCQGVVLGAAPSSASGPYATNEMLPACFPDNTRSAFVYVGGSGSDRLNYGVVLATADKPTGSAPFQILPIAPAVANLNPPARGFCGATVLGSPASTCQQELAIDVVRYAVAPDPADPRVPCLWRSSTGAFDSGGGVAASPPGGSWQLVARGIEDLQIRYRNGASWPNFVDDPLPPVSCAGTCSTPTLSDLNTIVRDVQITVWSRAVAANLSGQTTAAGGPNAVRGQLTTTVSPRAALLARNLVPSGGSGPEWY
jgi:prepilin-type N-terminal cleavage/methylation domain-containing protein